MTNVQKAYLDHDPAKLDGIWGFLFNTFRSTMASGGSNQYKQAHNSGRKRRKNTLTSVDLKVILDYCNLCKTIIYE